MTMKVHSAAIVEDGDIDTFWISLSESSQPDAAGIVLQRALSFDAQDRELKMDTYCVCMADGATFYGGITSCELVRNRLRIRFSRAAQAELGVEEDLQLDLSIGDVVLSAVRYGLARIFEDQHDVSLRLE